MEGNSSNFEGGSWASVHEACRPDLDGDTVHKEEEDNNLEDEDTVLSCHIDPYSFGFHHCRQADRDTADSSYPDSFFNFPEDSTAAFAPAADD